MLSQLRPEENPQNEFISINLNHVNNLKLPSKPPVNHQQPNEESKGEASNSNNVS